MIPAFATTVSRRPNCSTPSLTTRSTASASRTEEFAEELLLWLRGRLAHYKCRRSISFEEQLPRADAGKLYKRELVEKFSK